MPGQMQDGQSAAAQVDPLTALEPAGHLDRVRSVGLRVVPGVGQLGDHQLWER